uniref:Integrase core domain-containing protein n=1 Tax=Clytia hemisphaerica TaxID=252671 RepID=A0A7M5UYJ2_9CNID
GIWMASTNSCVGDLFRSMEADDYLDPDNEIHLFCLQYIFMPRINRPLNEFASTWNNHPLRTEGNLTPNQVWKRGFFETETLMEDTSLIYEDYGVDNYGPEPELQTDNYVEIPEIDNILTEEEQYISENFNPLIND